MIWKKFSIVKLVISIIGFVTGLIMKFPVVLESLPPKYKILGFIFTESQYSFINIISILILFISVIYIVILLADKWQK